MSRLEQLQALNGALLAEMPEYRAQGEQFPREEGEQRRLLRSLMNLRPPMPLDPEFLAEQDALLSAETAEKGVVDGETLVPPRPTTAWPSGRGTSPGCGRTPSSTRPTPPC